MVHFQQLLDAGACLVEDLFDDELRGRLIARESSPHAVHAARVARLPEEAVRVRDDALGAKFGRDKAAGNFTRLRNAELVLEKSALN